jgi:hypothetical protein
MIFGNRHATPSGFASSVNGARFPRVAKAQPWAGISQRLRRFRVSSKHFHPTRAARVGTPAWAGISQRLRR